MAEKSTVMVNKSLKTMAMITLISSVIWTALAIYNAIKKPIDLQVPAEMLMPIDPKIDEDTLEEISKKRQITDDPTVNQTLLRAIQLAKQNAESESSTSSPSSSPSPSPSATPEESESASASASL